MPWRIPLNPFPSASGTAVTAAALTSGLGAVPVPRLPAALLFPGARLSVRAEFEVTSTSATPTLVVSLYMGSVGQAIGSKTLIAATPALVINVGATAWPGILTYDGTFRTLSPTAGVIQGSGTVKSGFNASGGLAAQLQEFPFPITQALRTVSTLNTDQDNEVDLGFTLSSTTGTPSIVCTGFWADISSAL